MKAIRVNNLVKTYPNGTRALRGANLEVSEGDFFALLGANGAGKTTMIGILTGLINKTSGEAFVFDYNITTQSAQAKSMIGVVPQEFNFNMFEKVEDIITTQAGYFGIERKDALKDMEGILKRLELWEKRHIVSRMLSGGMKRRLMIARALINKPKLLILDEPTAGVDVELRHGMWDYLKELNKNGTTILLTTHYLEEVEQICRYAAIIKNGEIMTQGRVKDLIGLLDERTYVIHVDQMQNYDALKNYRVNTVDNHSFEIELASKNQLNNCIQTIIQTGMVISDIHPKANRLEKLFLKILKQN